MAAQTSAPSSQIAPRRSPEATARLAWWVLSVAMVCFLLFCSLAGYGLWLLRASIMGPQEGNTLEANASAVSLIHAGRAEHIAVPQGQRVPLRQGETVQVGESALPGVSALVTLWDGSTVQLYDNTVLTLERVQATFYSSQSQETILDMPAGQVVLEVARGGRYQQERFTVRFTDGVTATLQPGGNYLLRSGQQAEVAVLLGQARLAAAPKGPAAVVEAGQKTVAQAGQLLATEPARWQLLKNGDFSHDLEGWAFRSDQAEDGGTVEATYTLKLQDVSGQMAWAVALERTGGTADRCQGILSQEMAEDISPYRSVGLDFDLRIIYQSLPGGGVLGIDYPFNVRIRYRDADGINREYIYGFYDHTAVDFETEFPGRGVGETMAVPHYRWKHISLDLLGLQLRPVMLDGIDLFASGNDYRSWVANVSLIARR